MIDPLASRISIFKPTGELVTEVAVPEMFEPMSPIGETMIGTYTPDFLSNNRVTPKPGRIAGRSIMYDGSGRLWVGTRRDRNRFSYFDLYSDTAFAGSVQVRDRLLGFDILNGMLVTQVERALDEHDGDGIPDLGIDWYDVRDMQFGRE